MHIAVPADTATVGLTLQWTPLSVVSNIWHVLDVAADSPADAAGLLPYSDYILGTPEGVLHGEGGLSELVEDHIGRPLRLYVYNNEYDVTREVTIQPSRDWGGEGALGCVLGYGALHRLPAPLSEPVSAPGETMFDLDYTGAQAQFTPAVGGGGAGVGAQSGRSSPFVSSGTTPPPAPATGGGGGEFLVPAQLVGNNGSGNTPPAATSGGTAAPPRTKKKDRHHHGHGAPDLMDDYFKEEEKKSRELDGPGERRKTPGPPPPKAGAPPGGPPKAGETPPPPAAAAAAEPAESEK